MMMEGIGIACSSDVSLVFLTGNLSEFNCTVVQDLFIFFSLSP